MELRSLQSPTITGMLSALPRTGLREKPFVRGRAIKIPNYKGFPDSKRLTLVNFRGQASGTTKVISEAVEAIPKDADSKDDNLVFVAGATGRVGSRTVRELLKLGFKVRAGVRSAQKAESLSQSVLQMTLGFENASEGTKPIERLEIVECDLEKRDQIGPALGNASVVICCIGAGEKEVFDITGPYRIDYQATKSLIDAATDAKIKHFILLTSLGTNKIGFPAAILNLFWGVLIWKRKAEEALLASGLPYTIVRPGGMERPTDAYKETHNITLSEEDTLFGGQVSNLQVAELMAFMAKSKSLAYCKVVEVIAETTAPLTPLDELLAKVPSQRVEVQPLKESDAAIKAQSGVSPLDTPPEKEPTKAKGMTTRPLSPYIVYDDLKPPTSPTPTPSTSAEAISLGDIPAALTAAPSSMQTKSIPTEVKKRNPLSPYTNYDNLKPSSSPSPIPSGSSKKHLSASNPSEVVLQITSGNAVVENTTGVVEIDPSRDITPHQSPYHVYDDLKPPTSPSPNPPNGPLLLSSSLSGGSQMAAMLVNSTAQPSPANKPGDKHLIKTKQNPLSPFTVYEDL